VDSDFTGFELPDRILGLFKCEKHPKHVPMVL
jgi:hypothetical protein